MAPIQVSSVFLIMIYCFINFGLGSAEDELYKKFFQTDYKLKLGREEVTYCNKSVVEYDLRMYKYNRTQFVTNVTIFLHQDLDYDTEVVIQAYKFASNEYRIFPLRFEYNVCKGFKYNIAGVQSCINACGYMSCPFKKNIRYYLCNCILDESRFPPFMPTGSFKLQLEAMYKDQLIGSSNIYLSVYRPVLPGKRFG